MAVAKNDLWLNCVPTTASAPNLPHASGCFDLVPVPAFPGAIRGIAALAYHSFDATFLGRAK
jgi:hypothetical protein